MILKAKLIALTAPSAAGGVPLDAGYECEPISGTVTFQLDRKGTLRFRCSRSAGWYASAVPKQTVFYLDLVAHGIVSEWLFVGDVLEQDSPWVEIIAEPLDYILRDVGPMRDYVDGGGANYSQGLADGSIDDYLNEFVLPYLQAHGYNWITKGTIEDTTRHPITWERWTPMRLINELEERTRKEFRMRVTGELDFLERIGSEHPVPTIAAGKNLIGLQKTRSPDGFSSVVQAFGIVPENGTNPATSGLSFVVVSDVTGSVVTLSPGIVGLDDQYNGNYLQKVDGTRVEITDSSYADQTVTVSSASGISEGDTVLIVEDANGTLLEEAVDPNAVARVVGTWQSDDYRGEANLAGNPFVEEWDTKPSAIWARLDGDHQAGDTTITLKDVVPSTYAFKAGDIVCPLMPLGNPVHRVTANATASGGGVTLSVTPGVLHPSTLSNQFLRTNSPIAVFVGLTDYPPDGWTDAQLGTVNASIFQHHRTDVTDLTGTIVALDDYTIAEVTNPGVNLNVQLRVTVGGLPPGDVVYPGDALAFPDTASDPYRFIVIGGTVDGSGQVTVTLNQNRPTSSVGDTVDIVRTDVPDDLFQTPSADSILLFAHRRNNNTDPGLAGCVIDLPTVTVPYLPDRPNIWFKAGITLRGEGGVSPAGSVRSPRLQLWSDGALLHEVIGPAQDLAPALLGDPRSYDKDCPLSVGITLTEALTITPRIIGAHRTDTANINVGHPFTQVRWVMLQVGSDDQNAPPISGSHGTKLRLVENEILRTRYLLPEEIVIDSRERSADFSLTPPEAKIQYGGDVRVMNPWTETDTEARCVSATYDLVDQDHTRFVVTTRHQEATDKIERRFRRLEEGGRSVSARNAGSGAANPPSVVVTPPPGTGTGGTPGTTTGGRDIWLALNANTPTPTNVQNYWHVEDRGVVRRWSGDAWNSVPEASLADLREAQTSGAPFATVLSEYEILRHNFTLDDDGDPVTAGGYDEGTSFPGSPTTGDYFVRSDRGGIRYRYDGTRWLSVQQFRTPIAVGADSSIALTTTQTFRLLNPAAGEADIYVEKFRVVTFSSTTTASNYFTHQLAARDGSGSANLGSAISGQGNTQSVFVVQEVTVNSVVSSTVEAFDHTATETGTSSTIVLSEIIWRLVG